MAQKKPQYDNFADSIFNFIFTARRDKQNLRPPRPSGASGNEMVSALTEAATLPITYAGEQVLTPLQESLDAYTISSNEVKIDNYTKFKAEISAGNFADFVTDPESFIEKAFAKKDAIRKDAKKLNRIKGYGGAIDLAVGAILASASGLSGKESVEAGWLAGGEYMDPFARNEKAEKLAARSSAFEMASAWNATPAVGAPITYENTDRLSDVFYDALEDTRSEREDIGGRVKPQQFRTKAAYKIAVQNEHKDILRRELARHGYTNNTQLDILFTGHFKRSEERGQGLLGWDLHKKEDKATWKLGRDPIPTSKEREYFEATPQGFSGEKWKESRYAANKLRALEAERLAFEITFIQEEKNRVVAQTPQRQDLIDQLDNEREKKEKQFWNIAIWQTSNGPNMKGSKMFGSIYQHTRAFNEMVMSPNGGLVAIMDGTFFDDRRNYWSPSTTTDIKIHSLKTESRDDAGDVILDHNGDVVMESVSFEDIVIPKQSVSGITKFLTAIYYFTPGSIARTLFVNGEGFVYLSHLKQEKIIEALNSDEAKRLLFTGDPTNPASLGWIRENQTLFNDLPFYKRIDMDDEKAVMEATMENYSEVFERLNEQVRNGTITEDSLERLTKKLDALDSKLKNSVFLKYAASLNAFRQKVSIKNLVSKGLQAVLLKVMGKAAYRRFLKTTVGKLITGKVALRVVLRRGVKTAVHGILQSIGVATTGGLANALILILTEAALWLSEKLLKPVVKTITFVVWGIILLIAVSVFGGFSGLSDMITGGSHAQMYDTASHIPPNFCVECAVGGYDTGGETGPYIPDTEWPSEPPDWDGGLCPLGSNTLHCTQGPFANWSHCSKAAIDIGGRSGAPLPNYWYAPADGVVTHTSFDYRWGGIVHYRSTVDGVLYKIVHASSLVSQGSTVSKGDAIAAVNKGLVPNSYWTAAHWHLEVYNSGGGMINSETWYVNRLNCNISPTCPTYFSSRPPCN